MNVWLFVFFDSRGVSIFSKVTLCLCCESEINKQMENFQRMKAIGKQLCSFKAREFIERIPLKVSQRWCKSVHYLTIHWLIQTKGEICNMCRIIIFSLHLVCKILWTHFSPLWAHRMIDSVWTTIQTLRALLMHSSHILWCCKWNCWTMTHLPPLSKHTDVYPSSSLVCFPGSMQEVFYKPSWQWSR